MTVRATFNDDELMSVAEARQIMSETTAAMTDEEVAGILNNLSLLATAFIEAVRNDNEYRVNIAYNRGEKAE